MSEPSVRRYDCFISHSSRDRAFTDCLHTDLEAAGLAAWYFETDAVWGEPVWAEIQRAIERHDRVLLVCSVHSLASGPVLRELERALNEEDRALSRGDSARLNILFPITLDDHLFGAWQHPRKDDVLAKVVGNFRDPARYAENLARLVAALRGEPPPAGAYTPVQEKNTGAYLAGLQENCSKITPVSGRQQPLDDVFIMLQALRSERHTRAERPDIAPIPERSNHAALPPNPEPPPDPVPLAEALREHPHLVVLGEPGAGKSTVLQYIALCFARQGMASEKLGLSEPRIPLRLALRDVASQLSSKQIWQTDAQTVATLAGVPDEAVADALVDAWRRSGRLLLLLDGLDEVPDGLRGQVLDAIRYFSNSPQGQLTRIVVSSRLAGYQDLGYAFREYVLRPFADATEAIPFIVGWLAALRKTSREQAEADAHDVADRIVRQPGLARLLDNPLLLQLALEHYDSSNGGKLERNRSTLYRTYLRDDAWKRRSPQDKPPPAKEPALDALQRLAWALHGGAAGVESELPAIVAPSVPGADASDLLDFLRSSFGVLVRYHREDKAYLTFSHLTFREYLVAERLAAAWKPDGKGVWRLLEPRMHAAAWREPLLLLAAALPSADASLLVKRVRTARSPLESTLHRNLILAVSLAQEAGLPELPSRELNNECPDVRRAAEDALIALSHQGAVPTVLARLSSQTSELQRSALRALPALCEKHPEVQRDATPRLVNLLTGFHPDVRRRAAHALTALADESAVSPLINCLIHHYDLEDLVATVVDLLGKLIVENAPARNAAKPLLAALSTSHHPRTCEAAVETLTRLVAYAPDELRPLSLLLVEHLTTCSQAERAIGAQALSIPGCEQEAVPLLIECLDRLDPGVCRASMDLLLVLRAAAAAPAIARCLGAPDTTVRLAAVQALAQLSAADAAVRTVVVQALIKRLTDEPADPDSGVRLAVVNALGQLGDSDATVRPDVIQALIKRLTDEPADPDSGVRLAVVKALAQLGAADATVRPDVVPALVSRLTDDPVWEVRLAMVAALGQLGDSDATVRPDVIQALIKRLTDEPADPDSGVRLAVVKALAQLGAADAALRRDVVQALITRLTDPAPSVRYAVANALSGLEGEDTVSALIRFSADGASWTVRLAVVEILGRLGAGGASVRSVVVQALIARLTDDPDIRLAAVRALAQLGAAAAAVRPDVVQALIPYLSNPDSGLRLAVVEALAQLGAAAAAVRPDVIQALIPYLGDLHLGSGVCLAVVQALAQLGAADAAVRPAVVQALIARPADPDSGLRLAVVEALAQLGAADATVPQDVVQALITRLGDPDSRVSLAVVKALAQLGAADAKMRPDVVQALISRLANDNISICCAVVEALAQLGAADAKMLPGIAQALITRLGDTDPRVCLAVVQALAQLGALDAAVRPDVVQALIPHLNDPAWNVCVAVVKALGLLGNEATIPVLIARMTTPNIDVHLAIVRALGQLGVANPILRPDVVHALTGLLVKDYLNICLAAVEELGQLGALDAGVRPDVAQALISRLANSSSEVSLAVVRTLARLGALDAKMLPGIIPALISRLANSSSEVSLAVVHALAQLGDEQAVPPVIDLLVHPNPDVCRAAQDMLTAFGRRSVAPLVGRLGDCGPKMRRIAGETLRLVCQDADARLAAVQSLIDGLGSANDTDREILSRALARLIDRDAAQPLIVCLRTSSPSARCDAAELLRQLATRDATVRTHVVSALVRQYQQDADPNVRRVVGNVLIRLGDPSIVGLLIERLGHDEWSVRCDAIHAVVELGTKHPAVCHEALPPMINCLHYDHRDVRQAAAAALGSWANTCAEVRRAAVNPLLALLADPEPGVSEAAVRALGPVGDGGVAEQLIRKLGDTNAGVRRAAEASLGKLAPQLDAAQTLACLGALRAASLRRRRRLPLTAEVVGPLAARLSELEALRPADDPLPQARPAAAAAQARPSARLALAKAAVVVTAEALLILVNVLVNVISGTIRPPTDPLRIAVLAVCLVLVSTSGALLLRRLAHWLDRLS